MLLPLSHVIHMSICPTHRVRITRFTTGTLRGTLFAVNAPRAGSSSDSPPQLYGLTLGQLQQFVTALSEPAYRARQIAEWLYKHHADSLNEMSNLPAELRRRLGEIGTAGASAGAAESAAQPREVAMQGESSVAPGLLEPAERHVSADGTVRYVFQADDVYEAAVIPEGNRTTLCVSSQSGCRVGCKFCLTARKGLKQDLSAAEILGQLRTIGEREAITNIVYMGMGEPLHNIDAVLQSLQVLTADWGYGLSPRRITVSTVGILPELERLLDETEVNVALSLHAARRAVRLPLVPSENRYPAATIVELFRHRHSAALPPFRDSGRRRLSFEITMLAGVNDGEGHARDVVKLIAGLPCRVNLIPWNPFPGAPYSASPREQIERFQAVLKRAGIMTTIRESRGQDVGAACGLLAGRRSP